MSKKKKRKKVSKEIIEWLERTKNCIMMGGKIKDGKGE